MPESIRARKGRKEWDIGCDWGGSDASEGTRYGEIGLKADHRVIDVVLKTYRSNSYARSVRHINIVSKQ